MIVVDDAGARNGSRSSVIMEYLRLSCVLQILVAHLLGTPVLGSINCIRRACNKEESPIVCNQSLILISDVTNMLLERDLLAFENMKRACMGRGSCDPSRVCNHEDRRMLVIHYFCVNASHIRSGSCSRQTEMMKGDSGHIQSPGYPATTQKYEPCRWRIEPPNGSVVVLSLHDIAISGTKEECDGGLVVSGSSCDGEGHAFAPQLLCGQDNLHSLMRCGKVDIELSPSNKVYPLRFWLSFHVHSREKPSNFQASLLPCSGWIYSMDTGNKIGGHGVDFIETTPIPAGSGGEANTELLIIMLSIISGISAVLLIILIVVCVRCRLLHASHAEHVYSDPSPGLQAHYEYISSLESEKPRPQLADGYFEVADALPFTQRGDTPTSPAYAEVEQFAQLRKEPWSSASDDGLRRCKSPSSEAETKSAMDSPREKRTDSPRATSGPKRGVLGRLKHKQGEKDRKSENRHSTGPKIIVTSPKNSGTAAASPDSPLSPRNTTDEDNSSTTYEQIGEFSPIRLSPKADKTPRVPTNHPPPARPKGQNPPRNNVPASADTQVQIVSKVRDTARVYNEKCSSAQQPSQVSCDVTYSTTTTTMGRKPVNDHTVSSTYTERSKTLPGKHSTKGYLQTSGMKNNNYKQQVPYKDVPRAKGIVKNGIQKFEQNGSLT